MHAGGAMGVVAEDWLVAASIRMIIAFYSAVDAVNSLKGNPSGALFASLT
jgi:hypothetical protein